MKTTDSDDAGIRQGDPPYRPQVATEGAMIAGERMPPGYEVVVRALIMMIVVGPFLSAATTLIFLPDAPPLVRAFFVAFAGLLIWFFYWIVWRVPRSTISRFALDHKDFMFETPAHGRNTRPVADLLGIVRQRWTGKGGVRYNGGWLKFRGLSWVYLHKEMPNAELLIEQLGPLVGYHPARGPFAVL